MEPVMYRIFVLLLLFIAVPAALMFGIVLALAVVIDFWLEMFGMEGLTVERTLVSVANKIRNI